MADSESNLASFYLELFRQQDASRRDSERNRHVFIGFYITLTAGLLSFAFSNGAPDLAMDWLPGKAPFAFFLLAVGLVVAYYVTVARGWHCQHGEMVKMIKRMFENGGLDLRRAAEEVVCENRKAGWTFMSPAGGEFWMHMLVLLLLSLDGCVALWSYRDQAVGKEWPWGTYLAVVLGTILVGVAFYGCYLRRKQDRLLNHSPFIPKQRIVPLQSSATEKEHTCGKSQVNDQNDRPANEALDISQ